MLVHDPDVPMGELLAHKARLVAGGTRVRLESRVRKLTGLLDRAAADGYTRFGIVSPGVAEIELKPLS